MKWLGALVVIGISLGFLSYKNWSPDTDLLNLLPSVEADYGFRTAQNIQIQNLSKQLIFVITADDSDQLSGLGKNFKKHLKEYEGIQLLDLGVSQYEKLFALLPQRKKQILDSESLDLISRGEEKTIGDMALAKLYSPFGGSSIGDIKADPLGVIPQYFSRKIRNSKLKMIDGLLVTEWKSQRAAVFFAEVKEGYNNLFSHQKLVKHLNKWASSSELIYAGYPFYSESGARSGISEISTIGVGSLIGVIFLLLWGLRSFLPIASCVLLVVVGYGFAYMGTVMLFGQVHIFTLIIGASLVGVSIDYGLHFFSQSLSPKFVSAAQSARYIFRPLAVSFFSTLLGFSCLWLMPFEVLKQTALFFAIGLTTSAFLVLKIFPLLSIDKLSSGNRFDVIQKYYRLWKRPGHSAELIMLGLFVLGLILSARVTYSDDVRALQSIDLILKSQELQVKEIMGAETHSAYFVVRASDPEELLVKEESFIKKLKNQGFGQIRSVSDWIPSELWQKNSFSSYAKLKQQEKRIRKALNINSIKSSFEYQPLNISDHLDFIPTAVQKFWLGKLNGLNYSIVEVGSTDTVQVAIDDNDIRRISQADEVSSVLTKLREKLILGGSIALMVVALFLMFIMGPQKALRVVSPSFISCFMALGLSFLILGELSVFNILALYLVVALGVDYAIFYSEQKKEHQGASVIGINLSLITSLLSFGLLSLSQTAAISSFGSTLAIGLLCCMFLSPYAGRSNI